MLPLIQRHSTCYGCCTRIDHLSVLFGKSKILDDIDLHFHCTNFVTIIGPNGAGKTTLLKALLGEVKYQGSITFSSFDAKSKSIPTIGYVPQKLAIDPTSPLTVSDLFAITMAPFSLFNQQQKIKMQESLTTVGAAAQAGRRLATLSGGELQRVYLALALTPLPNLLLLDEPLSAIDAKSADDFYQLLNRLKSSFDLSIIMVSHDIYRVAKYADRMIRLDKKIIDDDIPANVLKKIEEEQRNV
ncbi:MAG: hypothetical protein A2504_05300 [Bdellovibrionales bacterium RIFOXYD12_FULL_39_22]|nr:MAG: hypothetical protein A2385_06525 [Bdellovibrionales bacterium RIFOXYB1_FULL_39_21]OFZ42141.1 MAG: hypothetical protein A2485_08495 [Bdellovibrionales bacterium RIFOXYC12_FULL_39_17]OFZ50962.1 MAG: hypothetical protein A2404_05445 [Bdellovibrionales bacterium RIFOXYC1_FULL_39_130]OFZ71897.1 MAG: hypothetical protein A2451_01800 [Bdellovibrionales bacterium RIFOXYC2_FULL_39_8]OFZ78185.1 MAG: hypothetical protein A2560_00615 [Bdellovibrionales bacterium RIFOXYD1_FULL_39_84]OFZ93827.1 MAG: